MVSIGKIVLGSVVAVGTALWTYCYGYNGNKIKINTIEDDYGSCYAYRDSSSVRANPYKSVVCGVLTGGMVLGLLKLAQHGQFRSSETETDMILTAVFGSGALVVYESMDQDWPEKK
jgi:hypothetical protein